MIECYDYDCVLCRIFEECRSLQSTMAFQRCVCQDLYMALIVNRINLFGFTKRCGTIKGCDRCVFVDLCF